MFFGTKSLQCYKFQNADLFKQVPISHVHCGVDTLTRVAKRRWKENYLVAAQSFISPSFVFFAPHKSHLPFLIIKRSIVAQCK